MGSVDNILPLSQTVAYIENPGPDAHFVLGEAAVPELGENQVLVKLEVSGIWCVVLDVHTIFMELTQDKPF